MGRYFFIGDVHGCVTELEALIAKAELTREDKVILVGDLVGKGPESIAALDFVCARGFESVLGNHDDALVRAYAGYSAGEDVEVTETSARILRKITADNIGWLAQRPLYIELPAHELAIVHAGFVPGVARDKQRREDMLTMRSVRPDGTASKKLEDGTPWASLWNGPEFVIFGHDAMRGLQRHPRTLGLDTGCVYGGRLTGCFVPSFELVFVDAKKAYVDAGKKSVKARVRKDD